ncbi:calmodulin-binding transcription activator 2 isoform X2 [Dendrobium catenatum]|uniref:calmodulin-binding transcription activator 2 isoform X2 n=1 Tax=Dendrobium catenatum TaxID=906689 RepID=UPI00109FA58B|nr:calmodulin-binding transcription activator 2 isoform X2 [Dendrobium catenatum]
MAEARISGVTLPLNLEQILQEAQHRWLRPIEICEILRNYHKFCIAPEPPNKPPSGSLFLFDRKVLRYFRKDGHNWRKKKDGKTVKEAHEKLKAGSVDVLHCYYAHGEDDENFQRRSYWMLEEELMHIVLVHYRAIKGSKANFLQPREDGAIARIAHADSPAHSTSSANQSQSPSLATDLESPNSTHLSEFENDSDIFQPSSRYNSFLKMQQYGPWMKGNLANACDPALEKDDPFVQAGMDRLANESDGGLRFTGTKPMNNDMASWHEILERCSTGLQSSTFDVIVASTCANTMVNFPRQNPVADILNGGFLDAKEDVTTVVDKPMLQFDDEVVDSLVPFNTRVENIQTSDVNHMKNQSDLSLIDYQGLKKYDSFSRWASNELGEVDDSQITLNSGIYWSTLESDSVIAESSVQNQEHFDTYLMSPLISHDQLFSIIDFSPNWTYAEMETKVLVKGKFFLNKEDVQKYRWSCMFGEIEVQADILADGTLCCHTPSHKPGRVPFYVTCSNRLACSEIREFEYKMSKMHELGNTDSDGSDAYDIDLLFRLEKLLILEDFDHSSPDCSHTRERPHINCTVCSMIMEVDDELFNLFKHTPDEDLSHINAENQLLEESLKEKLHVWLLHKVGEDGKGPNVLDKEGQGVLHLAAALGYDWAIKPIIAAGVGINFRDLHGWTALHWAAFFGRERTVVTLVALDASPGALTDPTPEFPSGRTPADLASQNGYKGIAGFLAESSLFKHLRELTLKDSESCDLTESSGILGYHHGADKGSSHHAFGGTETSLKDSLSAVRNATEAAARIYQVFRMQSFHRKKLTDYVDENCGVSNEDALSLIYVKSNKSGHHVMPVHTAAIKIQNKFRGWKGRKEFLSIRQHIVKIQAHVRGHQVRKHYRKILWSVGIVEKVILRWRRKGSGLRGFRSEEPPEGPSNENQVIKEDDYDFLQEGRKQTEARLEKALARVKSMVQYPEAIDQYRRLLNVVEELQESDFIQAETPNEIMEPVGVVDLMLELEGLLQDDPHMPPNW